MTKETVEGTHASDLRGQVCWLTAAFSRPGKEMLLLDGLQQLQSIVCWKRFGRDMIPLK